VLLAGLALVAGADTDCRLVPGGGFCLTSPDWVWLGELTADQVQLSEEGELSFSPLGPATLELSWRRWGDAQNGWGVLFFRATQAASQLRWEAVEWRPPGGTFSPLPPRNQWRFLALLPAGTDGALPLEFRYLPTLEDLPGKYWLQLQFRLDLFLDWRRYRVRTRSELDFLVHQWCILTIPAAHMHLDLGTIGPELYDPVTDTWTPLSSAETSLYAATNSPQGLAVVATATDLGVRPADLARLRLSGGELQGVPLDRPQQLLAGSAPGLYQAEDVVYQYLPSWEDQGGTYRVRVTYTLLAP